MSHLIKGDGVLYLYLTTDSICISNVFDPMSAHNRVH